MPELPEVETVVRTLAGRLAGWTIERAATSESRVFRDQQFLIEAALPGSRVIAVRRYGKNILIELGACLLRIHLGMTGKLLFESDPEAASPATHPRATLWLTREEKSGKEKRSAALVFDDIRQFGRFEVLPLTGADALALGPEPLEIGADEFRALLKGRRGAIKNVLLNQRFLRGMGNIYSDEALFLARIHPLTPAASIPSRKATALHLAMRDLLEEAIAQGGSSISDYVDADGRRGAFQNRHQVYGKAGESCPRCGAAIRRIVVAQRGTHFCPRCQRAPQNS